MIYSYSVIGTRTKEDGKQELANSFGVVTVTDDPLAARYEAMGVALEKFRESNGSEFSIISIGTAKCDIITKKGD